MSDQDVKAWAGDPNVLSDLGSADGAARRRARVALVLAGQPAVPVLIGALSDPRLNARWEAAKALNDVRDVQAIPALISALTDDGPGVRWLAADALAALGRASLEPLLHALVRQSGSVWLREGAHHVMQEMAKGDLREVVLPVLNALEGVGPEVAVLVPGHATLKLLEAHQA